MSTMNPKARRRLLKAGTSAHYEDAHYYDNAYRSRKDDVAFYTDMARSKGGPVLELGVGTGRVAIDIAHAGIKVVGIDRMAEMLTRAKERIAKLPKEIGARIDLRRGDIQRVRLGKRFPLVISPFNVFMHLYELKEIERTLQTVHAHLTPKGTFVFDVLMPVPGALARDPSRFYKSRPIKSPADGKRYAYSEAFQYDGVRQVQMVTMVFEELGNHQNNFVTPLAHRQFYPEELKALLHYNGFKIDAIYGDYNKGPLTDESESQIVVARKATR
ncbi:MAG: class I SAM-dependent methyltransferase [Sandaracinaceae bacterium]|nr:class I SAM-dependent methyltransferase [Sandaracinaceae bacterium]